jgi:hypothetical protein
MFHIKLLENKGYKIDSLFAEKIDNYDLQKYDYVIIASNYLTSTIFEYNEKNKFYQKDSLDKNHIFCKYNKQKLKNDLPNGREVISASKCIILNNLFENNGFTLNLKIKFKTDENGNTDSIRIFKKVNK